MPAAPTGRSPRACRPPRHRLPWPLPGCRRRSRSPHPRPHPHRPRRPPRLHPPPPPPRRRRQRRRRRRLPPRVGRRRSPPLPRGRPPEGFAASAMGLIERRVALLLVLFLVGLGLAAARTAYFGAVRGSTLSRVADAQQVRVLRLPAPRGTISDRRGVELAVSEPADDVSANPRLIRDPRGLAERLAPLLERDVA